MTFILIVLLLFFSFVLIKSTDFTTVALKRLSKKTHTGSFVLSALILALGTSFPEIFVALTSAVEKAPSLALGVVIGSNIANIALITGISSLAVGKITIRGNFLKRDVWIALISGLAPVIFIADGEISRSDGVILLLTYSVYAASLFKSRFQEIAKGHKEDTPLNRFIRVLNHTSKGTSKDFLHLLFGIALLLISAGALVRISKALAISFNVPIFVIGLVIVAIGTSLPELAFSFRSLKNHEPGMFFGNILGSTIVNSTLVIGLASIIHPIKDGNIAQYGVAALTFILVSTTFWFFANTKRRIDRWEGLLLVIIYIIFIIVEFT